MFRVVMAIVATIVLPAQATAQTCRTQYSLDFVSRGYSHPQLSQWIQQVAGARLADSVAAAQNAGYPKEVAQQLAIAQADSLDQNIEQSIQAARALSSDSGDIRSQIRQGLPSSYNCDGAAATSVCAAQIFYWQQVLARQTAEGIACLWR